MVKILLIRHGETEWNEGRRYQGQVDIPLSQRGQWQADCLASRLAAIKIEAIYSSDLARARDTAYAIASRHNLELQLTTELRELNFGQWEGKTFEQIKTEFPPYAQQWLRDPAQVKIPGGESFTQLLDRSLNWVKMAIQQHPDQTLALVAHGGTLRVMLCGLLGLPLERMWVLRMDNASLSMVEVWDKGTVLTLLNDTAHWRETTPGYKA